MSAAWETNTSSEGGYVSQLTYLLFIIYLFWDAAECNQCRNIRAFITVVYEVRNLYCKKSFRITAQVRFTVVTS